MGKWFTRMASAASSAARHYLTFLFAVVIVLVWALSGPLFGFSQVWQLVINTGTTIITFLMVFLIQNTQNRDSRAIHLKLDELLRAISEADDEMISAEDDTDEELKRLKSKYDALCIEHNELKSHLGKSGSETSATTGQHA
ncbi:MAG: low affinity iron permease family protein [Thermomicrobiales bacterium]